MKIAAPHRWDVSPEEAMAIQQRLREQVVTENRFDSVTHVAGVDVGFEGNAARAAVVVLRFPELVPVDQGLARVPATFPYIPGLLAFREAPAILAALELLTTEPDLIIVDGQGLAHPRRMGIASHLGVLIDKPTIGCAKSILVGRHEEPGSEIGDWTPLVDGDEVIGAAVRTRPGVAPVYVSIGHRIDLESAIRYVLACTRGYRLPETTRYAHRLASGEKLDIAASQPKLFDL